MSKLTQMLDKYRKTGNVSMRVGIMGDKTYPDGVKVAQVGVDNEYGVPERNVPARPFFRATIENNRADLPDKVASLMQKHDVETALRLVGDHMVGQLSDSVQTWTEPPNAESTIRKKGYNAPLRETKQLARSFSYEIEK